LEQAGPVLRKQMEALTEDGAALTAKSKDVADVPDTFVPILKALLNQKWSYRTVNGIAKEREVAPDKVRQTLQQMRQDGFVQRSENSEPELWFLTDKGYDLAIAKKLTSAGESEKP
jgi:RIO-like serine/threonine protein kinase